MDRPAIVIRDIHRYGEDLTVPEAIARLCGGGPVTVTVTGPAPPGGDPRGTPRHGSDVTITPADGPGQPPHIAWAGTACAGPGDTALFAEALALASQLASLAAQGGRAAAIGAAHGREAARRALARATPAACGDMIARLDAGDPMVYDLYATPALSDTADLAKNLGLSPAGDPGLAAAEDAYFTAAGEAFWAEAERIARDRATQACGGFQRGDRVALVHTGDAHTRLRPGDEGTVTRYDAGVGQLDVRWDSGSTLAMLLADGDRVRLITPAPAAGTGETGTEPGR